MYRKLVVLGLIFVFSPLTVSAQRLESKEAFEQKLSNIKNEKKKEIVKNVSERACGAQKNVVERMNQNLVKMGQIVERVEKGANGLFAKAVDTTAVTAAVADAKSKLTLAKEAVASLSALNCEPNISGTENKLGSEIQSYRSRFAIAVRAANEKMVDARKAVSVAVRELAQLRGEKLPAILDR